MFQSQTRKVVVWMAVTAGSLSLLAAQTPEKSPAPSGPAPVLMTVSEVVQPGAEAAHAKLEADYTAALDAAKGNQFYLGMGALTGTPETVFLSGYASLDELASVHDQDEGAIGDKLAALDEQHSGTLAGVDTAIWRLRPGLSNPNPINLARMRFIELIHLHVKLGHGPEFAEMIKQMREGWMKADPDFHYSIYQQSFGSSMDDSYLVVIAVRSLADLDKHHAKMTEYRKIQGEDARKRTLEFESTNYDSVESNLFAFTPSMSRLPGSWTKEDAEFWKPMPPAAPDEKTTKAK